MAQVTSGIRAIFSMPAVYSAFQNVMGAHDVRTLLAAEFIRPPSGRPTIIDIGCGPADIMAYLPDVSYFGFDISAPYIDQAHRRYGHRGEFYCHEFAHADVERLPKADIVLALGLLHHLDDAAALDVMRLASSALKPMGRLVTFDPCFAIGQNPIARLLVSLDRGRNVRSKEGYGEIAHQVFDFVRIEVRHRAWIPYTHCFMECTRK